MVDNVKIPYENNMVVNIFPIQLIPLLILENMELQNMKIM